MLAVIVIGVVALALGILYVAYHFSPPPEDEFRRRWGGSDARQTRERSLPCPACGGHGYDEFGECVRCKGKGYVIWREE